MPIAPKDILGLADALVETGGEVACRAAVGRAYYAAFHALLPVMAYLPPSRDRARQSAKISHSEIHARLSQWSPGGVHASLRRLNVSAATAQRVFQAARALRELADYRLDAEVGSDEARLQLMRCRQLLRFAAQVENETARGTPAPA